MKTLHCRVNNKELFKDTATSKASAYTQNPSIPADSSPPRRFRTTGEDQPQLDTSQSKTIQTDVMFDQDTHGRYWSTTWLLATADRVASMKVEAIVTSAVGQLNQLFCEWLHYFISEKKPPSIDSVNLHPPVTVFLAFLFLFLFFFQMA